MPLRMHPDQVDVDADLVRRLVAAQHPEWARLPIDEVRSDGTVNAIFRLGDDLCARLPLQASGERALAHEQEWLPWLAPRLPFPIPEPVASGEPEDDYPHRWAIYRWLPGNVAPTGSASGALVDDLVTLLLALRSLPIDGAPTARGRRALADHDRWVRPGIARLDPDLARRTAAVWDEALAADDGTEPSWVHGDLMPPNLLVTDGRLTAVIDWGEPGLGDPASDLWCAWSVLDAVGRGRLLAALDVDDAAVARSRGWVVRTAATGIPYYTRTNPGFVALARQALDVVLDA